MSIQVLAVSGSARQASYKRVGRRQTHAARRPPVEADDATFDGVDPLCHLARQLRERLAGFGRHVAARLTIEQTHAERSLERVDAAQHGAVIDPE